MRIEIIGKQFDEERALYNIESADILDEVDIAFYGDFKELDEEQKESVRNMVRLMRGKRAAP